MMAAENEMKTRAHEAEAKVLAATGDRDWLIDLLLKQKNDLIPSCLSSATFPLTAKLLAATNETKRATAMIESLAKEAAHIATATLLAQETKNEKMEAVEEAKILATAAVLLAATNESKYAAGTVYIIVIIIIIIIRGEEEGVHDQIWEIGERNVRSCIFHETNILTYAPFPYKSNSYLSHLLR